MRHIKKFSYCYTLAIVTIACVALFLVPGAVFATEEYYNVFDDCIVGESVATCDLRLNGVENWTTGNHKIQDDYVIYGSKSGAFYSDGLVLNDEFDNYNASSSYITLDYTANFEDKNGYTGTKDIFGLTGVSYRLVWDGSSKFDLWNYDETVLLEADLLNSEENFFVHTAINCETNKYDFSIITETDSDEYSVTSVDLQSNCGSLMYFNYTKNYPGKAYADSLRIKHYNNYDDYSYGEVIIEEIPPWRGNIRIGSDTKIQYNSINFCYLGTPCYLKFNYGYDTIGAILRLLYEDEVIASTTLPDQQFLQGYFIISDPGIETTENYCISFDNGPDDRFQNCDVQVIWIDNTWCNEDTICADIATTSEFFYGFECGFKKFVCWIFNPTSDSINFFSQNIQNFESSFPFNTVFDVFVAVEDAYNNTSSTSGEFGLPMYNGEEYYTVVGIDENTYNNIFGTSTVATLELYASYIAWAMFTIIMVLIVWKFGIL